MVARPDTVHRLGEDEARVNNVERRTVRAATDRNVIDPATAFHWHLAVGDERIGGGKGMSGIVDMRRVPS